MRLQTHFSHLGLHCIVLSNLFSVLIDSAVVYSLFVVAPNVGVYLYPPPPANFVCGGYTVFTLSVRACVRPSVTFCFLINSKSHCWIFIKPCKHVHICKTNTLDKNIRVRDQFY